MNDLGDPCSYHALEEQVTVYSKDGEELGAVEHVLAEPELDVFDGIVLDTSVLPGGRRFVDASQVSEIYERGVVLGIDAGQAQSLPEPSSNPGVLEIEAEDVEGSEMSDKLRRAWELISGKW